MAEKVRFELGRSLQLSSQKRVDEVRRELSESKVALVEREQMVERLKADLGFAKEN